MSCVVVCLSVRLTAAIKAVLVLLLMVVVVVVVMCVCDDG